MNEDKHEDTHADSTLIMWLLTDSGVSRYRIAKDIGISEATISRIVRGETTIASIRFGSAQKLTAYAEAIQQKLAHDAKGATTHGEKTDKESIT